jgi:arsenite methyltransferase
MADHEELEAAVREHYANRARAVASCCQPSWGSNAELGVYGASRYDGAELDGLPAEAVTLSIGCANPVALVDLRAGEVVLDLGAGGGIDVLLSARRVGPAGKVYGLDMTDEMLEVARANQARAGIDNVEFLFGHIEAVPLPDASVDVVISNCVVNLSTDKPAVFAEIYRVLRPGGRVALADVVANREADEALKDDLSAWANCLAGAITRSGYRSGLKRAGFVEVSVTDSHEVADGFFSAVVRALKPRAEGEM